MTLPWRLWVLLLTVLAGLITAFGMQPGLVTQFLPVVIEYVKSVGGNSSSKLLTGALGM